MSSGEKQTIVRFKTKQFRKYKTSVCDRCPFEVSSVYAQMLRPRGPLFKHARLYANNGRSRRKSGFTGKKQIKQQKGMDRNLYSTDVDTHYPSFYPALSRLTLFYFFLFLCVLKTRVCLDWSHICLLYCYICIFSF